MPLITSDLEFSDDYPTIEPSLRLDFANARALDPRITFTRASTATYVGRDGLIKTAGEDEARFDHDPATGESLGLLIEESRTNLITYSEDVSNAAWSKNNSSIQSNSIVSPFGDTTADKVFDDTTTGATHSISLSFAKSAVFYTGSVYVKAGEYTKVALGFVGVSNWDGIPQALFDLSTGQITSVGVGGPTANITAVGNGWYRCILTAESLNTTSSGLSIGIISDSGTNVGGGGIFLGHDGDGSSGLYVWGAQVEAGAFPTSYIPTSGSTATREKEFPVIETSSIDFNDFSQGGEGTLLCEFSNAGATGSDIAVCFSGDTHNGATFVGLGTNSNRNAFNRNRVDATNTVLSTDTNFTTTGFYKVGFGIGQSRCTLAVRGSTSGVLEDTSVSYDSTPYTKLILGCDQTSSSINNMINGTIKSVFYYPTLLSDTQLQTLTQ